MHYTDSHEWVRLEGEIGSIGISIYAQKELGEIVYVQLPEVGQEIKVGEEVAILESTKAAADVYSPVSGRVVQVNEALQADSSLINTSPEGEGYLFKIKVSHPEEIESLLSPQEHLVSVNGS